MARLLCLAALLLVLTASVSAQPLTVALDPFSVTAPLEIRNDTDYPVRVDSLSIERSGSSSAIGWSIQYTVDTPDGSHGGLMTCEVRSERPSAGGSAGVAGRGCFFDTRGLFGRVLALGQRIVFREMTPICGPAIRAAPLSDTLVLFTDGARTGQAMAIPSGGLSATEAFVSLTADQTAYG